MPRDSITRICNQSEINCYESAEDKLMIKELSQSLESGSGENKRGKTQCNCLPSCTSIKYKILIKVTRFYLNFNILSYDAEISQADYEFEKVFNAYGASIDEFPGAILARLTIFFKEAQFITSKRSELYGLTGKALLILSHARLTNHQLIF